MVWSGCIFLSNLDARCGHSDSFVASALHIFFNWR